jgi:hypothetical protein
MQVALVATLLLAAVWFVALRPKAADGGGGSGAAPAPASAPAPSAPSAPAASDGAAPGTEGLTGAIDKAHGAVTTANADAARAQRSSADGAPAAPAAAAHPSAGAAHGSSRPAAARRPAARGPSHAHRPAPSPQVRAVRTALRQHRAVAIAFVDPHTADARAVAAEIGHVSRFGGRALTLAVPLARLSDYDFITNHVEVTVAPTVVIVDPRRRATTIVGFADRGEIEQRLADALAVKRRGG